MKQLTTELCFESYIYLVALKEKNMDKDSKKKEKKRRCPIGPTASQITTQPHEVPNAINTQDFQYCVFVCVCVCEFVILLQILFYVKRESMIKGIMGYGLYL